MEAIVTTGSLPPDTYKPLGYDGLGMSNLDRIIDKGFAEVLKECDVWGQHAALNFNALIWYDGESFRSAVYRFHELVSNHTADSLEELMVIHNDLYGSA